MELKLEENIAPGPSTVDTSGADLDQFVSSEAHPEKKSFVLHHLSETTCDPEINFRQDSLHFNEAPKRTFKWGNPAQNGSYSVFDLEGVAPTNALALGPHGPDDVIRFSDILNDPFLLREAKASLGRNKAATTPTSNPLECGACGKAFLQKNSLIRHLRLHTGERPFACHVCGKAFSQKNVLDSHLRVHTGERPFVCHVCGKGHAKVADLKRHVRTHTGEKPYKCDACEKAFSQSAHLKMHLRIHSKDRPFACGLCEKTFARNTHLKVHMFSHTKERRFACDRCDKAFSLNTHLTRHQRTHTGERPFVCDVCQKAFFRRDRMRGHLRKHHGTEKTSAVPADR